MKPQKHHTTPTKTKAKTRSNRSNTARTTKTTKTTITTIAKTLALTTIIITTLLTLTTLTTAKTFTVNTQADWNKGQYNMSSADRDDNSGDLGIGYLNGTLNDNLTGFWRFDAASDPLTNSPSFDVKDYSGNKNNGTATNFDGDERGKQGVFSTNSFDFDGSDDAVTVDDSGGILNISKNFTISVWFKTTDTSQQKTYAQGNTGDSNPLTYIHVEPSSPRIMFDVRGDGGTLARARQNRDYGTGKWVHAVGVRKTSGTFAELYINGTSVATDTTSDPGPGTFTQTLIGATKQGSNSLSAQFNGNLDEIRVYDRALSASEVKQLYVHGRNTRKFRAEW
ncbi:MAG: LamG domain-containing protein, partial [Candidatus Nanohaloarchaea archaeon]|nr:LamG domain-containing protein [Candidatus Nanohaloarchaea archaeon]